MGAYDAAKCKNCDARDECREWENGLRPEGNAEKLLQCSAEPDENHNPCASFMHDQCWRQSDGLCQYHYATRDRGSPALEQQTVFHPPSDDDNWELPPAEEPDDPNDEDYVPDMMELVDIDYKVPGGGSGGDPAPGDIDGAGGAGGAIDIDGLVSDCPPSAGEEDEPIDYAEEDYQGIGRSDDSKEARQRVARERRRRHNCVVKGQVDEPAGWNMEPPQWRQPTQSERRQVPNQYWKPRQAQGEKTPAAEPQFPNQSKAFKWFNPLDVFLMFFPIHIFRMIAKQTNRRFEQKPPETKESDRYKKRWRPTSVTDWVRFMGIILLATLCKQQHMEMYWAGNNLCKVNPYERAGISYHKFRLMKRYMHCMDINDPVCKPKRGEDNYDPLAQIRYVYDSVRRQFHVYVKPGQDLAIDELMVACKLRTHLQQCIKGKPTPNGIKIFALAGMGGLVHDFIIDDGMVFARRPWALNGEAVILEFVERMELPPLTRLYFDRWFVSVRIIRFLAWFYRIKSVGPIQANRRHLPVHKVPNNAPENYPPSIRILVTRKSAAATITRSSRTRLWLSPRAGRTASSVSLSPPVFLSAAVLWCVMCTPKICPRNIPEGTRGWRLLFRRHQAYRSTAVTWAWLMYATKWTRGSTRQPVDCTPTVGRLRS
jgi:hypothetical protein